MATISVHDNLITGYVVACEKHQIVLHTEFRDREPRERTDIVFTDVDAYLLMGDNMNSILFDIAEEPIDKILGVFSSELEAGIPYCWPGPYNLSRAACREHFTSAGYKGWQIFSSYGMAGFVIARTMEIRTGEVHDEEEYDRY